MAPVGPLKSKKLPEPVRRQMDVAAATAWEALVSVHAAHALRFVALMAARLPFDEAVDRYLSEMDLRDPMSSAVRSRVLVALEDAQEATDPQPELPAYPEESGDGEGLRRFRPDVLMKGIARRVRETGESEQWIALAIARAEEGVIKAHIDNALVFASLLDGQQPLDEAVEDYIELLKISGGRAQAVYQRTMARLAELHLPDDGPAEAGARSPTGETGPARDDDPTG